MINCQLLLNGILTQKVENAEENHVKKQRKKQIKKERKKQIKKEDTNIQEEINVNVVSVVKKENPKKSLEKDDK